MDLSGRLDQVVRGIQEWADDAGPFAQHPSLAVPEARVDGVLTDLLQRLRDNYPFHHPRYAGQMLKPPHPVALAAYAAAQQINPNAHALDGGPATAALERDVMAQLAAMIGFGAPLGHLTSSGTIANLEALFVARSLHPGRGVAFSAEAHYTHARMCQVLGMPAIPVPADASGRMDLAALDDVLRTGRVGTVVLTAGTTGLGAVDPIDEALPLARSHGVRVHVDAAYGGFFALLAHGDSPMIDATPWLSLGEVDSLVIDPHKHGLQPYGCGAVLFADPSVGQFYIHDSPYTYFTSDALHLGEISLECSRAGASAAALWATLQVLPLRPDAGLGAVVAACRRAAVAFDARVAESAVLRTYQAAQLDIVTVMSASATTTSAIDAATQSLLQAGMADADDPVFVSTLKVSSAELCRRHPDVVADSETARIVRCVLMKPEHEDAVDWLVARLASLIAA